MPERPALRVIDTATGEIQETCANCQGLADQVDGLEKDVRAWRARYANLKRDKDAEARGHKLWPHALDLFNYWRQVTNHPRAKWTADRFWLAEALIREYGTESCRKAIDGAAYDPFVTKRKNGSTKRHDGWDLVFRDSGKLEEFANRAPRANGTG